MEAVKPDEHSAKIAHKHDDHKKHEVAKNARMERHSGDGHKLKEGPKKEGGGRGNWGTFKQRCYGEGGGPCVVKNHTG
ncbi:hypothetical protein MNEG_0181 [Monoraphidium neglectum]|uniref:Hyaluronan/mRNA-binding protein domain-containing protein n=1 Tax=Monoraphidium neglectum TaxID=145388 RepID=A0A0D2N657_9CHLO|nr:hypothetical protein MNEG_0181 [Monoraphidium neglectum]KIZ07762.1 hypothetical protein MNEG_0181 [Monoraphidium neglectum]|eukprot:XP_013906781.1 hypothetical protein MNEG_0181 [Monoraphidium neglectum]